MKFLGTLITVLALVALCSLGTVTMSGCGDDPVSAKDSTAELGMPQNVRILITSATTVQIKFKGVNSETDFRGYILMNAAGDTVLDSIKLSAAFNKDTSFTPQTINRDVSKTWTVASFDNDGARSQSASVTFHARGSISKILNKYGAGVSDDGLNVDGTVSVVDVEDALNTSTYLSPSTADFVMENRAAGGAVMTPINNSYLIYLPSATDVLDSAAIETAKASVNATTTVAAVAGVTGAYIFYNGKSIRVNGSPTATPDRPTVAMCFLVVSSAGNVARLVVESVTGTDDATVTYTVYTKSSTPGTWLYKK